MTKKRMDTLVSSRDGVTPAAPAVHREPFI